VTQSVTEQTAILRRLDRLQGLMNDRDLDAVVLSSLQNVAYFGGTYIITQVLVPDRLAFLIARRDAAPTLLVCDIEETLARAESPIENVEIYVEFEREPVEVLADLLAEYRGRDARIGLDTRRLPGQAILDLQASLPGTTLESVDAAVEALQVRKDEDEVQRLEHAARATQQAFEEAIARATPGCTEQDLAAGIYAAMAKAGGAPLFLVLGAGPRSNIAHPDPLDVPMPEGTIFRIDAGARFSNGGLSDLARTGIVGEPAAEQTETLTGVRRAQAATIDLMEPGRPVRELYRRCESSFAESGIPFRMPHIGHGLGIALHEEPRIHPASEWTLEPGMVINIEPLAIVANGTEAYHVEDLVLVTDDGHRLLTTPQEELLRLGGGA
jgi:Xaa-Pro aminopeptidase